MVGSVPPSYRLKGEQIRHCIDIKYLGLWFDGKLTFKEHAKQTAAKADSVVASISQFMSNLGGLSEGVNVAMSVLLYGDSIWADAINAREYRRMKIVSVQQKATLRCVSAYCTVSTQAVCVMAGIPRLR